MTAPADDFRADAGTAGRVAVGGSATGELETLFDRDWFAVELEAGKTYRIDLKGASTGDGTLSHPALYGIFDSDGNGIPGVSNYDGGVGSNSRLSFTATKTATYYVGAVGHDIDTRTYHTGTYTLSVAEVPEVSDDPASDSGTSGTVAVTAPADDYAADTGTAGRVAVGGSATGEIEARYDRDWFAVELEEGKTYRIDLKGAPTGDGTLAHPALYAIFDADGHRIGRGDYDSGEGSNSRLSFTATESATYYVAAFGYDAHTRTYHTGTYTLSVAEATVAVTAPADDFRADAGTAGRVAVGGSATGEIEAARDVDWFAVELEAGKTYRIDLKGSPTGDGTLAHPVLHGIKDAGGNRTDGVRAYDGGGGTNSHVLITATGTATYYVAAAGYDYDTRTYHTGTYTLSVTYVDDFTGDTGTAGSVAVGGSATGEIELRDDRDWFAVELEAGKTYRIDLKGASTGDGTLAHPNLFGIYDAGSNYMDGVRAYDGGVGTNSHVLFTATDTATHYVVAEGQGDGTGTYTLSVAEAPEVPDDPASAAGASGTVAVTVPGDDFPAGTGTSGTVAVGGSATGELEYEGDYDWFAVELQEGKTYQIDLKGASANAGTLRDPHLGGIYDRNGTAVAGADDDGGVGRASLLVFTASETATYYVAAGGRNAAGYSHTHQTGTYALSVTEINADDHTGDINTAARVAVGGSARGEIESGGDRDWFAVGFEAGKTYRIDLKGASTGDGTLADPVTGVFVNDGTGVCRSWDDNDGVGANALSHYTALASGTHFVLAAGAHEGFTGTYTVFVEEVVDAL